MRVAGIMSGTSLDGIDVAVVDIRGRRFTTLHHSTRPYPAATRQRILAVSNREAHISLVSRLNFELARLYAAAVERCGMPLETIHLIGCHGQTVFHEQGSTLQLGDGSVLAERLGIPVVSDFRPRDIAAGGQGAPLVPFVDYWVLRHPRKHRVALNLGGIANITVLPAAAPLDQVIAFDTGPANMVIDQLVEIHTAGKRKFDRDGRLAQQGRLHQPLLRRLLNAPYFRQRPPKSAGREQYGHEFVADLLASGVPLPDLITTATAFTAATVAQAIERFSPVKPHELIVSGGGAHNPSILAYLQAFLPAVAIRNSTEFGLDADAKEAIAFALLAYETWHKRPSNVPSATGARRPAVLGKLSW